MTTAALWSAFPASALDAQPIGYKGDFWKEVTPLKSSSGAGKMLNERGRVQELQPARTLNEL